MKILITGGSGLIGKAIASRLKNDFEVYSLGREVPSLITVERLRYIPVDLSKIESIAVIKQINPELIIHCAALIPGPTRDGKKNYLINSSIDKNVLSITHDLNCHLVYTSSTVVYGYLGNQLNVLENQPVFSNSPYAQQKIESEIAIKDNIKNYVILRINAPYGKHSVNETVLTKFVGLALHNKPLLYHGSGGRMQDFTNVDDIASLIQHIINHSKLINGTYNISNGEPVTMLNLAKLIVSLTGSKSEIRASGQTDAQENYKASYSIELARKVLGWNPKISIREGIEQLINRFNSR